MLKQKRLNVRLGSAMLAAGLLMGSAGTLCAQSHSDREFLEKSAQGNVAEVELAKLALKKSTNPSVKEFAQKMIHDHEMLAKQMLPFLQKDGIHPPTVLNLEHQHLYNKLNGLNGAAFDKEYVNAMDKDHHEDLKDFQSEFNSTKDMELKNAVGSGEKVIAEHTRMIDEISQKMGMKPAGQ